MASMQPDGPNVMATQGFQIIQGIGSQMERRMATTAALATARTGMADLAVGAGTRLAVRGATRYAAAAAIPVAGEIAGAGMLAYDVLSFGYKTATGQDFETTAVGGAVHRASSAVWGAAAGTAAFALDKVGATQAAALTRGPLLELLTGDPQQPTPPTAMAALAPDTPERASARLAVCDRQTQQPGQRPITLAAGPERVMSDTDWQENPYRRGRSSATMTTTPSERAFATMDAVVDDLGLPRLGREQRATATPVPARGAAPSAGIG